MKKKKAPFTPEQCREFIEQYSRERPKYEELADVLVKVLKIPAGQLGLPAMVQARAKDVASFAGKIQRPEKGYTDPLNEITDFCGARVITLTLDGVSRVCDFIERNFQIFWEDSEDKLDSLGSDTFGYLSTHYIVAFREGDFPEDLVPARLIGLKAEVQVRTLLQHAWADIAHEFSYKNAINLPLTWKRELSRLAAMLEEGDQAFDRLQHELLKYASSYQYHYTHAELADEIARSEIVLEVNPQDRAVAHKLAKLAMTLDDWKKAVDVLSAFGHDGTPAMMRDLGVSQCKLYGDGSNPPAYQEGQQWIQAALKKDPKNVDAWASLGGTWRTLERASSDKDIATFRKNARECYRRAFEVDATDPYALGNFIEYELVSTPAANIIPYFRHAILSSIERSEAQARAGVNLPWAYLSLGEFYLFLDEPLNALQHYALGVDSSTSDYFVTSPLRSFDLLDEAPTKIMGLDCARAFLEVAAAIKFPGAHSDTAQAAASAGSVSLSGPILIVAGGSSESDQARYRDLVLESFSDFRGTVISGGTKSGIAADVGELGAARDGIRTIGYVPADLPGDVQRDTRYDEHRSVPGDDFSPREIIEYWNDLHAAGVPTDQIRLIAFGGGALSAFECCAALA
ncbi:MAG: RelA/SpoT domain-containing protein, partial [Gammaproteobacteria bacterium]|nr:RelA/SpoT domain-containing protein [Gammaproteobacteria bacterium]